MKKFLRKDQVNLSWFLLHKRALARPEIKNYFMDLLLPIKSEIDKEKVLEIGAGSGLTKNILFNYNFLSTDIILDQNKLDFVSDIYSLPFLKNSFDLIFAIDVLHHLRRPEEALNEIHRVLNSRGHLILIEPHISAFSYFIYKLFHHEKTSWRISPKKLFDNTSDDPLDADNSVLTSLLFSKSWQGVRDRIDARWVKEIIQFRDIFSFFFTGGLQREKSFIKGKPYEFILKTEKKIPQILLRFLGSRLLLILRKLG